MLDIEKIRQLIEMMVENDLVEVSLRDGEEEINLRRPTVPDPPRGDEVVPVVQAVGALPAPAPVVMPTAQAEPAVAPADDSLVTIDSPMVGTYYAASDPDSAPFVQVGTTIQPGAVLCILEAMKVFNEIKAEIAGTIEKILVKNSEAVEFGQPLFQVRPA